MRTERDHAGVEITVLERETRPFNFADLRGRPEPKEWGPKYPTKTLGAAVEKWRKLDKKRELTADETRAWGAAVGEAIRRLNRPARFAEPSIACTVQNTVKGACNTAEGEARRYAAYVERLNATRLARRAADPDWLNRRIVEAFDREFEDLTRAKARREFEDMTMRRARSRTRSPARARAA